MRKSAQLVSRTLGMLAPEMIPGADLVKLDKQAESFIRDHGGEPGFLGLYGCPSTLLISVNEAVVHGLPGKRRLEEGDVASVDCGVLMNGYYGDHAYTFAIGEISDDKKRLLQVTKECLYRGIAAARVGNRIGDIGHAIQEYAESNGYTVVRELIGHGLGTELHEKPDVPNYGRKGSGKRVQEGLTIAIEPMINMGSRAVEQLADGWTIVTADRKASAHFEHDVAVMNGEPHILSSFEYVYRALGIQPDPFEQSAEFSYMPLDAD